MECPNCHVWIDADAELHEECGWDLHRDGNPYEEELSEPEPDEGDYGESEDENDYEPT